MSARNRSSNKTSRQLARRLQVEESEVSRAARRLDGISPKEARDKKHRYKPEHCRQIAKLLGVAYPGPGGAQDEEEQEQEQDRSDRPEPAPEPGLDLPPDPRSPVGQIELRDLKHPLLVHRAVLERVGQDEKLGKRLGIVLQHFAAHGRTPVVKGCADEGNRGWLRSPLGGNHGMQYYLWWTRQDSQPVKALALPPEAILVRAIRHHDDHAPLDAGEPGEFFNLDSRETLDDGELIGQPWTEQQLRFVDAPDPVRLVHGRPGSGKTTVLWMAVEARNRQRVLYLTWSQELARVAEERFASFAPAGVEVNARDFATLVGEIRGQDVPRRTLLGNQSRFAAEIDRLGHASLGPWKSRVNALYAEIRAHLLGRATPDGDGCLRAGSLTRLTNAAYLEDRGADGGIGRAAARALLDVVAALEHRGALDDLFPELAAAAAAVERLRRDALPPAFDTFDRIVVDEAQDLTLLELAVVVELCRAVARERDRSPWLLVAGDEGQTVRPSGFAWGPYNDLVARRVGKPSRYPLAENLRCPARIAAVIERASEKYAGLNKELRPGKQAGSPAGQHVGAQLFHVVTDEPGEAATMLEELEDEDGLVVLSPDDQVPGWLPAAQREMVHTPAQVKGLEYQSIVLLDPGRYLARLEEADRDPRAFEIEAHAARTTIDQLRVALSRATETLVFVDVDPGPTERALSRELLGDPAPYSAADLAEHFRDEDKTPEQRVVARIDDARNLIEERPRRAWQRAVQAVRLLGAADRPNGVADPAIRRQAHWTVIATAAKMMVTGPPPGLRHNDLTEIALEALDEIDSDALHEAFEAFEQWVLRIEQYPIKLLQAAVSLGENDAWLREALAPVYQELRQEIARGAKSFGTAADYSGDVAGWLELTGFMGDAAAEADGLRRRAVDTLIEAEDFESAEEVLERIEPPDLARLGRLREAQQAYPEAAETFERAGQPADALRNWRAAGRWGRALPLAADDEELRADLEWLGDVAAVLERQPAGQRQRMVAGERRRLQELFAQAAAEPDRRGRSKAGRDHPQR